MSSPSALIIYADPDLADIIPGYLKARLAEAPVLQQALTHQDWKALQVAGHKMRGTGGSYGFQELTEIGEALEEAASEGTPDSPRIQKLLTRLQGYLTSIEVRYSPPQ